MQFKTLISAAALLIPAWAIEITNFPFPQAIQVGQAYTITWQNAVPGQPVTLRLRQGDPGNLSVVGTITTSATGNSYSWTPDVMIASGTNYALEISQTGGTPNYSMQFAITGSSSASVTASLSSRLSSASSALSSASSASVSSALSSLSSVISSRNATITSSASTASATASRATTTTAATTTGAPTSGNSGSNLQSPIALILGAFAAMMYFN